MLWDVEMHPKPELAWEGSAEVKRGRSKAKRRAFMVGINNDGRMEDLPEANS